MLEEKKQKRSNAPLYVGLLLAIVGVIGGTFAYFTSTDTFTNTFQTDPYNVQVVETFDSPTDWVPGTTTSKTVVATNNGNVPVAVRVRLQESWVDAQNQSLPLTDGTNAAALINFHTGYTSKWTQQGGYYYYKTALDANESTETLIDSVTFNPAVTIATSDTCVDDAQAHTRTCTTTTSGYGGGTYTLTVTVETVQFDSYATVWSGAPTITNP